MRPDEDGFTLIELIIAMMILFVIVTPLATSFVLGLAQTRAGELDAGNSADSQLLASYFEADVANAETVSTSSSCGGSSTLLSLTWTEGSSVNVVYRTEVNAARKDTLAVTSTVYDLQRLTCSGASITGTTTLARSLSAVPTVTCDSGTCSATPRRVSLTAKAYATELGDPGSTTTYTFGVTAQRRVRP